MVRKKNVDIPKEIVAAVLVLTILVSVLGTWLVIDGLSDVNVGTGIVQGEQQAKVRVGLKALPITEVNGGGRVIVGLK